MTQTTPVAKDNHNRFTYSSGQSVVEYALLLILGALAVLLILSLAGVSLREAYCRVITGLGIETAYCESAYCSDEFDDNMDGWNIASGGGWEIQDGQLCSNGNGWHDYSYNSCSKEKPPADYIININSATLFQGMGYGVFFRLQDYDESPSGYAFQYDPGLGGAFVARKWVNGYEINPPIVRKVVANYDWFNQPRDIQIHVIGDTFAAFVDGEEIFSFSDGTYSEGGVGLRYWYNSRVCIDGFSITPIK